MELLILLFYTVPDDWATIEISNFQGNSSGQDALDNTDYTLVCAARVISGMTLPVRMEWVGPDGAVVRSEENRTVGEVETYGTFFTLTLTFHPVFSSDGGRYTCRAATTVPWMTRQPATISNSVHMPVTSECHYVGNVYLYHCLFTCSSSYVSAENIPSTTLLQLGCKYTVVAIDHAHFCAVKIAKYSKW